MSYKKSIALSVCLAVTGCAHTPQNSTTDSGFRWWPFGADQVADKGVEQAINESVAKADAKPAPAPAAVAPVAQADSGSHWWWPFGGDKKADAVKAVPTVDPKETQAWLDAYEPKVRAAVVDSQFTVERRENVLVIIAPVDTSFNPKRPEMLLPISLGPITNVAKAIETDPKTAVLVLGHGDTSGASDTNLKISQQRAQSVAAIFRLSGLERNRLSLRGMGSVMPRAANDSLQGRALNRRVEIMLTPQNTMLALLAKYNSPTPPAAALVAVQDVKPAPAPAPVKKAVPAKKKVAPAKPAAKKKVTPAKAAVKKPAPAKKDAVAQASGN
ncbi:MAG: OmpA family protein [Pseudomonas sp.]|uniref:OmpA family protein n=1 Tax=Pseudomonas abieticivorans TaxID=2931382 RepID=UPI0020BE711E|nr:OmpA family protein [Pseudomonas sp. PIA16]MDE1164148.1 OmpA family protein [Pseudomonas sp.]